jgi:hypothetical protein
LLVRDNPAGFAVRKPPSDRLYNVQVVQDVIEAAIVWQTVEERPNGIFGRHMNLREDVSSIRPAALATKFESNSIRLFARRANLWMSAAAAHNRTRRLHAVLAINRSLRNGGLHLCCSGLTNVRAEPRATPSRDGDTRRDGSSAMLDRLWSRVFGRQAGSLVGLGADCAYTELGHHRGDDEVLSDATNLSVWCIDDLASTHLDLSASWWNVP